VFASLTPDSARLRSSMFIISESIVLFFLSKYGWPCVASIPPRAHALAYLTPNIRFYGVFTNKRTDEPRRGVFGDSLFPNAVSRLVHRRRYMHYCNQNQIVGWPEIALLPRSIYSQSGGVRSPGSGEACGL